MSFQSTQPSQAVTSFSANHNLTSSISIHTAFAGCDDVSGEMPASRDLFQSTQPSQAVTSIFSRASLDAANFNPHSLRRL